MARWQVLLWKLDCSIQANGISQKTIWTWLGIHREATDFRRTRKIPIRATGRMLARQRHFNDGMCPGAISV